jgi:hypothetical protein
MKEDYKASALEGVLSLLRHTCELPRSLDSRHTSAPIRYLAYTQAGLASQYEYDTIKRNFNVLNEIGVNPEILGNIFWDTCEVMKGTKSFNTITVVPAPAHRTTGTLLKRLDALYQGLRFIESAPISANLASYLVDCVEAKDLKEVEVILNIAEYVGLPSNDIANLFLGAYNALRPRTR